MDNLPLKPQKDTRKVAADDRNGWFFSYDKFYRVLEVHDDYVFCNAYKLSACENIFTKPCNSKSVNICKLKKNARACNVEISKDCLGVKVFCYVLPESYYYLIPLCH